MYEYVLKITKICINLGLGCHHLYDPGPLWSAAWTVLQYHVIFSYCYPTLHPIVNLEIREAMAVVKILTFRLQIVHMVLGLLCVVSQKCLTYKGIYCTYVMKSINVRIGDWGTSEILLIVKRKIPQICYWY